MKDKQANSLINAINRVAKDLSPMVFIPKDTAATDVWEWPIFKAPFNCKVKDVIVIPATAIGQATNYMTLDAQNKGLAGAGTTSIGSRAVNSTNTMAAMVGADLVTSDATVAEGEVISLKKTVTASGQVFPGGVACIRYEKA